MASPHGIVSPTSTKLPDFSVVHFLAVEKPGQTLQATALVQEAYMRLVDVDQAQHWNSRGHFFAAAAEFRPPFRWTPGDLDHGASDLS
jgi:hypothetical protein